MSFKAKIGVILLLTVLVASCTTYRNNFGRKRFICCKFTMKRNTNNDVYKIIDTTKIYKLVSALGINGKDSTCFKGMNKYFLKFYGDGKVDQNFYHTFEKNILHCIKKRHSIRF